MRKVTIAFLLVEIKNNDMVNLIIIIVCSYMYTLL